VSTDDALTERSTREAEHSTAPHGAPACTIRVLGPLEVESDGLVAELGPPKQRALLVLLALSPNEVVATDRLILQLWGERAPRTARHSIQIYVSELRKAFSSLARTPIIATRPPGYRLEIAPEAIDAHRFEELVRHGRRAARAGDVNVAADAFRAALTLWRGPALAEFVYEDFAQSTVRRLHALRLDTIEELARVEIEAHRYSDAMALIAAAREEEPLREDCIELLMLALYRSGRHVDALRAYEAHRQLLADELGVVPSPPLRQLHERILLHDESLGLESTDVRSMPEAAHNPYKGLRPFGEGDTRDFFGRDALVEQMIDRLAAGQRLIALVGPSGAGKSSVVAAGLVPRLRAGAVTGSADWRFGTMRPGPRPLRDLAAATGWDLVSADDGHEDVLITPLAPRASEPVLLVIDQFEDLFLAYDAPQRQFLDTLTAVLTDPHVALTVVITLRADHYDGPLQHPTFGRVFTAGVLNLLTMAPDEIEAAVVRPAERVGVDVEPELLAQLVADTTHQPGSLPLLQYALADLFDQMQDDRLTLNHYRAMGGMRAMLSLRAEELYQGLNDDEQFAIMQVMLRTVRVGRGGATARRRVPLSELTELDLDAVALSEVLDRFVRHRLLSFDRDPVTGAPTVDMAHEALLVGWARLADWVDRSRIALRRVESIRVAAEEWEESDRHTDYLLGGTRLTEIEASVAGSGVALTRTDQAFLDASTANRDAELDAEATRRDDRRRLERRARRRLIALALALVMVVAAVIVVIVGGNDAEATGRVTLYYAPGGEVGDVISDAFDEGVSEFGLLARKVEDISGDLETGATGQDLVIVFQLDEDVEAVARSHPATRFVVLDRPSAAENVTSIEFAAQEGAYLVGAAAALKSETGTIGFIGGVDMDVIWHFQAGFEAGARAIDPDIRIVTTYLSKPPAYAEGFLNPTGGESAARQLYADGADVVFAAAGSSGLGVLEAAVAMSTPDNWLWAIGVDSDQYQTVLDLPGSGAGANAWRQHILTSMVKRFDVAVHTTLENFANGGLDSTPQVLGLAEGGVDIAYSGGFIAPFRAEIEALRERIASGEIQVPCRPVDRPPAACD
jgi:basic membrane lipoprotein Med (substrate-binding protein (PBP1-ABC) superfamily)/DNA-binding SARP family transcriptional activator